ncbi:MAG: M15 family metallopeptidase, partial [Acidimicrobiia bacterium]|nr:M15 family metallopeptidase [Acidimicrobiia bacterium]
NNTSAYNCRTVAGTSTWSQHAYGRAVDINPLVNPWVQGNVVDPPEGAPYVIRDPAVAGLIVPGDVVTGAFAAIGWGWGGTWTSTKDYQHFSATGR